MTLTMPINTGLFAYPLARPHAVITLNPALGKKIGRSRMVSIGVLAVLMATLGNAHAADPINGQLKPGQWETRISTNAATLASMPTLPPEQLQKMKEMGIDIPAIAETLASQPITVQQCISPEQARLDKPFTPQNSKDCNVNNYKHLGNKVSGEIVCSGEMKGTGKFEMTLSSSTEYHATTHINGSGTVNGTPTGPIHQQYDISGKWLKASCDPNIIGNGAIQ